jgi:hypothetical protein
MSELPPAFATPAISPTLALRIWLTNLLTQTEQARVQIRYRIEDLETEAVRLRENLDRAERAAEGLRASILKTDEALAREREATAERVLEEVVTEALEDEASPRPARRRRNRPTPEEQA